MIKPLPLHRLIKIAFLCDQFVICTVLDDFSAVQNDNPVALANRGKSVRNDDKIAFNYLIFWLLLSSCFLIYNILYKTKCNKSVVAASFAIVKITYFTIYKTSPVQKIKNKVQRIKFISVRSILEEMRSKNATQSLTIHSSVCDITRRKPMQAQLPRECSR